MTRTKIITILLIVSMLGAIPASVAQAAIGTSVPGTGTIQSIILDTDKVTSVSTVLVTLSDGAGSILNVRISLESATKMGLVVPAVDILRIGQPVSIPNTNPADSTFVLSGTVNTLVLVIDPVTGFSSLAVTLTDSLAVVHEVSLNLSNALLLGLITTPINTSTIGTLIIIDPLLILESTTYSKAVTKLGAYFGASLGLTYDQLAAYTEAGFGYGVIAQACWMATQLDGDAALLDKILAAKSSGDFSTIPLPDGTTAANWGQFRKIVLTDPHQNLGSIMSGKATPIPTPTTIKTSTNPATNQGNRNGNANGNGNDKSNNGNGGKK